MRSCDFLLVPFALDGSGNWFCVVAADCFETGTVCFLDNELEGNEAFVRIAAGLDDMSESAEPDIDTDNDSEAIFKWIDPEILGLLKEQQKKK